MKRERLRRRMAQHPKAVSFDEARRVLEAYDWVLDHVNGSHHVFYRNAERLVIPLKRPHIMPVYVRQILNGTVSAPEEGSDDADNT